MERWVKVFGSPEELASAAADAVIELLRAAIERNGVASVALSGGSTPEATYKQMRARASELDWSRLRVFMSDERFVEPDDPRSNFGKAKRVLLDGLPIPVDNLFPVDTSCASAEEAALRYEALLLEAFGGPPDFDLILLGLGEDGHTASLFPGSASIHVVDRFVVATPPGTLQPPVERVTFTYPCLNAAQAVVFLVSGEKKAKVLQMVLEGDPPCEACPAACVAPESGRVLWLIDAQAASLLRARSGR